MSQTLDQIFIANPITSNAATDLMYFAQSPYTAGKDAGMTYANFAAQFGAPYTAAALTKTDDTNVTLTLGGSPSTALLHAASLTLGWTGTLSGTRGGTGVNNGASTITVGGNFAMSGAFTFTGTLTGNTAVTFPTSGTLATTGGSVPSIQGTANQVLVNGTSGSPVTGSAITLTTPQNIGTASSPQFTAVKTGAILDSNGVDVLQFNTTASAVNWLAMNNSGTGGGPTLFTTGSDPNINMTLLTTGTGQIVLDSQNTTTPIVFNTGTSTQHTTNFSFANTAASRTVTFPDASGTVAFTSTASGIVNSGLINQLAYYAAAGTTLSGLATAASGVLVTSAGSVPSISTTLPTGLAMGTPASLILTNATGLPIAGTTGYGTGVATALAANVTGSGSLALANGPTFVTSTVTMPSVTFSTTSGVIGTTTNNNAAAGSVGEFVSSVVADTTVTLTTNTAANVTSISLTAGDWDVWGNVVFNGNSATTVVYHIGWISTTSATLPADTLYASKPYSGAGLTIYAALVDSFVVPQQRISIAGTTTVYLSVQSGFGVNADKAGGAIYARRVR